MSENFYGSNRMKEQLFRLKATLNGLEGDINENLDEKYTAISQSQLDADFEEVFGEAGQSGIDGVVFGETEPISAIGKNGDYYYLRKNNEKFKGFSADDYSSASSSSTQNGYVFTLSEETEIAGLRGYINSSSHEATLRLYQYVNGQYSLLKEITDTFVLGWNNAYFSEPLKCQAGTYLVEIVANSQIFRYWDINNIKYKNPLITILYGVWSNGRIQDSSNLYSADIIINVPEYRIEKQYIKNNNTWNMLTGLNDSEFENLVIQ